MKVLVTETREYEVDVDSGPKSYAARRAKDFGCSVLDMCKKLATIKVMSLPAATYSESPDAAGVMLVYSQGVTSTARGMAPGENRSPENEEKKS